VARSRATFQMERRPVSSSGNEKSPVLTCDLYEVAYCDNLPCDGFDLFRRHHSFSAARMAAIGSRSVHGHGNGFTS
jgi:hypothetical protein